MATLYDYFVTDATSATLSTSQQIHREEELLGEITTRIHFDFQARAKFVSLYIEDIPKVSCPEAIALNGLEAIMEDMTEGLSVEAGFASELTDYNDLLFTGQIYIYSERAVSEEDRLRLQGEARNMGHKLTFRSTEYVNERSRFERPQAFICHDHRDKSSIARPLAHALQKRMCMVWFDDFSLCVGDSLRSKIEKGIKECSRCIVILTQNFLNNEGWGKREYDSVFTREIVEEQGIILPVWYGVSRNDVFQYSPVLADKVGVDWKLGNDEVARKLVQAIKAQN